MSPEVVDPLVSETHNNKKERFHREIEYLNRMSQDPPGPMSSQSKGLEVSDNRRRREKSSSNERSQRSELKKEEVYISKFPRIPSSLQIVLREPKLELLQV